MKTSMPLILAYIVSSVVAFAGVAGKAPATNPPRQVEAAGQTISLEKYKGDVVVLYFFSDDMDTWDKPIRQLNNLKKEFAGKNVRIGALTGKSKQDIKRHMKTIDFIVFTKSIDFSVVTDSDSAAKRGIKSPCVYVIGPDGKIRWRGKLTGNVGSIVGGILRESSPPARGADGGRSTDVFTTTLDGELVTVEDSVPKPSPEDDPDGIPDPGVPEGTVFVKDEQPSQQEQYREAHESADPEDALAPVQEIEEYPMTPESARDLEEWHREQREGTEP